MPDVLITVHNPAVDHEKVVGVAQEIRQLVGEAFGVPIDSVPAQLNAPKWSTGYGDVDIAVMSSPHPAAVGKAPEIAESIKERMKNALSGTGARSFGVVVWLFGEGKCVTAEVN